MKKYLGLAALCLFSNISFAKRMIIQSNDITQIENEVRQHGGEVIQRMKYRQASIVNMSEQAIAQLQSTNSNLQIEEDYEVSINGKPGSGTTTQPAQTIPWGISRIKATQANTFNTGSGVKVCVVDTGIQKNHPDLEANIIGGENFVAIKGVVNPNQWDDDNDHGTHVSGTIAALNNSIGVVGVAPNASLFGVKVLDRRGSGFMSAVADGILSCVLNQADVISMSLGSASSSTVVYDAIQTASNQGIIIVAAAGNESGAVSYPAAYPEVIAVSATNENNQLAYFSNFGPEVDIAAPGTNVLSTTKGSTYKSFSGTSMATPHIAGVVALMLSSGKTNLKADDIGLAATEQGLGLVNALRTVTE